MARQAERREATQGAILRAATHLFQRDGFAAVTVDDIATAAGVAKGAVYHHFTSKESLFEAVFDAACRTLLGRVIAASADAKDLLHGMVLGTGAYFAACAEPEIGQIILQDGPAVLGWVRWRQLDEQYFGAMVPAGLQAAMDQGLIAPQPVEPLARLLIGAVTEAAVACAESEEPARTGQAHVRAFASILEGLRLR